MRELAQRTIRLGERTGEGESKRECSTGVLSGTDVLGVSG